MKGKKRIVVFGVLAFILGAIAMFPARLAYSWFAPAGLQLSGIDGTIWHGSASEGLAGGIYIRDLSWNFRPLALLTGQLAYSTKFDPASGFMDADVAVSPGGNIAISNVAGSIPIQMLQDAIQPLRGFQGSVSLQLDAVIIEDGVPTSIDGIVGVAGLMAPMLSNMPIGNYRAVFHSDDDGVHGIVEDVSGVLDVEGTLTIAEDRSYAFIGQVAPRPDTPPLLVQQLQFLGSADAEGKREFRFEGRF